MQLDLPQELPRRRLPDASRSAPPLEAGPLEGRRERLAARIEERRMPNIPRQERGPDVPHARPRESRSQKLHHDQPVERRTRRNEIPPQMVGLSLREQEVRALAEVGRFRVVTTRDLADSVYGGNRSQLQRDLRFLEQKGVVELNSVNARRDGRGGKVERIEVVTLTREGSNLVRQVAGLREDQKLYAGMVKPREVEHDAQIYRAYRKEAEQIEQKGGTNLRVQLDFELKSDVQKAIHAARKAEPERDMAEIKQQVARQFELPYVNDGIQIPDARIQYDMDQGSRTGHEDVEVLTAAYRTGHLHNKAQAGFHLYASSSDRATLTSKIEGDHHLMENILEL
jgi:ribosomal protein S25